MIEFCAIDVHYFIVALHMLLIQSYYKYSNGSSIIFIYNVSKLNILNAYKVLFSIFRTVNRILILGI